MGHNEAVMANEYMADCKLKFILNNKYRGGQIAQGFTPARYFQCKIEFNEELQEWVRNIDLKSMQACANHFLQFFRNGGTYNATDAAHSELLSQNVVEAEFAEYMSIYPPDTQLVAMYAKLKGNSAVFNAKCPQVRQILNNLRGATSKIGPKSIGQLSLTPIPKLDKKIIEVDLPEDEYEAMSQAGSTASTSKNTRRNAGKKLRKQKAKAAAARGDGVPADAGSPAAPTASSSRPPSCYHDSDDAVSTRSWTLTPAVPTQSSSSRATSTAPSAASSWDIISNADAGSDASARKRRKAATKKRVDSRRRGYQSGRRLGYCARCFEHASRRQCF